MFGFPPRLRVRLLADLETDLSARGSETCYGFLDLRFDETLSQSFTTEGNGSQENIRNDRQELAPVSGHVGGAMRSVRLPMSFRFPFIDQHTRRKVVNQLAR